MIRKKLVASVFVLVVTISWFIAIPAMAADTITWRLEVCWDPGTTPYKTAERFVKKVDELTGGRMKIKLFGPGSLVPAAQMLDSIQAGMFEMMWQYEGYYIGKMPEVAFTSSLPLEFSDAWQFETWFWKLGGVEMLRKAYAKQGVYYIGPTIYGEEPIHSKFPIHSIEDMKGKKGRFVGIAGPVMQRLGAVVTPLPTAEVYPALEKGVIDFADRGGLAANYDAGLYEVAKYIILPGFHQPTTATCFAANMAAWNKLPKDIQGILETLVRDTSMELFEQNLVQDFAALEKFKEKGVTVIHLPDSEIKKIRKVAMEVWEEYANKSPEARAMLDSQKKWLRMLNMID